MTRIAALCAVVGAIAWVQTAHAMPIGPTVFCETYPDSRLCAAGNPPCSTCHTEVPYWNAYGTALLIELLPDQPRPLDPATFAAGLRDALREVEAADADLDGHSNLDEIEQGTLPGSAASVISEPQCPSSGVNPYYDVCNYDHSYAYRKLHIDFCGQSPDYSDVADFQSLDDAAKLDRLDQALDACLDTEFWLGKDGQVWQLAHRKIRPVGSLKAGEDASQFQFSDYYDDYNLFVYGHTDGRDVRDLLTGDYFVVREVEPTRYTATTQAIGFQSMQPAYRAGMMTTQWRMIYDIMFTPLPRTIAAQMYRSFLGFDIAQLEGLYPVEDPPADYDDKGVAEQTCAMCHSTLDPLTYPFRNYNGLALQPGVARYRYVPDRLERNFPNDTTNLHDTPEAGYVLGQPVNDLREWAQVAANSREFAAATVKDYWTLLIGEPPRPSDDEFHALWRSLMNEHGYSVEAMLHDLIKTEAYGAP